MRTLVTLIASDPHLIPPELICHIGAQEGWIVEVLTPQAGMGPQDSKSTFRAGFEQWNNIAGASATTWWSVPHRGLFAPPLNEFDREGLARHISVAAQQQDWKRQVALHVRSREPDIVIVPTPNHTNPFEGDKRLYDLALEGIESAGKPTAFPNQLRVLGLRPWSVSKTMSWSNREGRGGLQIMPDQFALSLGRSLADQATPMRFHLQPESVAQPPRFQVQIVATTLPVTVSRESIAGGLLPEQARSGHRADDGASRGTYQQVTRPSADRRDSPRPREARFRSAA
ncbi:MAG: hypothetical protein R3B96_21755 [Pirellulaceae bacterium]